MNKEDFYDRLIEVSVKAQTEAGKLNDETTDALVPVRDQTSNLGEHMAVLITCMSGSRPDAIYDAAIQIAAHALRLAAETKPVIPPGK